jgi:hypothetical protein
MNDTRKSLRQRHNYLLAFLKGHEASSAILQKAAHVHGATHEAVKNG